MVKAIRLFLALVLLLSVDLLAYTIGGLEVGAQYIIKMGHDSPETSHLHEFAKKFKEVVESHYADRSGGEISWRRENCCERRGNTFP